MNKCISKCIVLSLIIFYSGSFGQNIIEFSDRVDMGIVNVPNLWEASGMVESRQNKHVLWAHNDRNNDNRIFAFNPMGEHLGDFWLNGITNRDWEDMAIGPGPDEGTDYLYIGDVGDNDAVHDNIFIYRLPEPNVNFNQDPVDIILTNIEKISLQYPDGKRDSEAILLDPVTKDLYVVSKRENGDIGVYRAQYPQSTTEVITLEKVSTLELWMVVSGDISYDGSEILLKTIWNVYYWHREAGESISKALENDPIILPYIEETQGEIICWSADKMGYYTLSEGRGWDYNSHLYFYPRIVDESIVVSEIMDNPLIVDDNTGEWFEIYNSSGSSLDLNGWEIKDNDSDSHIIQQSLVLTPGEYKVLGKNSNQAVNGGVDIVYQYENFNLDNDGDEIIIKTPLGDIADNVAYDNGLMFPNQEGKTRALLDPNMDNNFGMNWREATNTFGNGDYGTPGLKNFGYITEVTIREIQYPEYSNNNSPFMDQIITTSGVLMAEPFGYFPSQFYIQDSNELWSGLIGKKDFVDAEVGDRIKITGTIIEGGSVTSIIEISDYQILEKAVFGIDPLQVSTGVLSPGGGADPEAYESMLVTVSGICDNDDEGWRKWSINDGTGGTKVYNPYSDNFSPVVGDTYTVTGHQYFRDGAYCLLILNNSNIQLDIYNNTTVIPYFELKQNFPNPFNPNTTIQYSLPNESSVTITVYNMLGKEVNQLISKKQLPGEHSIQWNGTDYDGNKVGAGIYLFQIQAGDFIQTKKMVLMK
ncbi:lamin tail domain-containing protein [Candidatus Neomarinimicrobiota bacterium]